MALPPYMVVVTGVYYSILGSVELSAGWRDSTRRACPAGMVVARCHAKSVWR